MSDTTTQNQPNEDQPKKTEVVQEEKTEKVETAKVGATQEQIVERVNDVLAPASESVQVKKKPRLPRLKILSDYSLVKQYGILGIICVVVLAGVYFLFTIQWKYIKGRKMEIGRIVEEKVKDALAKNLNSETGTSESNKQGKNTKLFDSKKQKIEVVEDNSKYVIEANRLYETGDYRTAAAYYEKGMNKSMPFLHQDFVLYRLGDSYLQEQRYEDAIKVFQALNNDFVNTPYQLKSLLKTGECYAGLGEFKKARKMLYTVVAQEGKCASEDDKCIIVDSYFKIADYYMEEAERLRKADAIGTSSVAHR